MILDLDAKVRAMVMPPTMPVSALGRAQDADGDSSPGTYLRTCVLSQFRSCSMLFIHRSFFVQALLDYPDNPLGSPYATSFLATYRAASAMIRAFKDFLERYLDLLGRCAYQFNPHVCQTDPSTRWWVVWTQLFSAGVSSIWPRIKI